MEDKVSLTAKLALFDEKWSPKIIARVNDYDVILVKVKGEFVWHKHDDTDDFFLVRKGHLTIQLRDRNIELDEGELFVVPGGIEHSPRARRRGACPTHRASRYTQCRRHRRTDDRRETLDLASMGRQHAAAAALGRPNVLIANRLLTRQTFGTPTS